MDETTVPSKSNLPLYFMAGALIIIILLLVGSALALFYQRNNDTPVPVSDLEPTSTIAPSEIVPTEFVEGDMERAKESLVTYFDLLAAKEYAQALDYHGSGYELFIQNNPDVDPSDYAALLKAACEQNGFNCLKVRDIVEEEQVSATEFKFMVQFTAKDGSLFERGPCCGATEEEHPIEREFEVVVVKEAGNFLVTTQPPYVP